MQFGSGSVRTEDFDYILPEELIAQTPLKKRDSSRITKVEPRILIRLYVFFKNFINDVKRCCPSITNSAS